MSFGSYDSFIKEAQFRSESASTRADAMADAYEAAIEKIALGLAPGAAALLPHTATGSARSASTSAKTLMKDGPVLSRAHFNAPSISVRPHSGAHDSFSHGQLQLNNGNVVSIGRGRGDHVSMYPATKDKYEEVPRLYRRR